MNTPLRPSGVARPAASYELGMLVPAGSDLVHTAGIVGTAPDGSTRYVALPRSSYPNPVTTSTGGPEGCRTRSVRVATRSNVGNYDCLW